MLGSLASGVLAAAMAWMHGRQLGAFGAGLGIVVQGLGLLVMNLTFASILARLI